MRHVLAVGCLCVLMTGCGATPTTATPTTDLRPTQTRAAEVSQLATLSAPTATSAATATPVSVPTNTATALPPTATNISATATATNTPIPPTVPPVPPTATAAPQTSQSPTAGQTLTLKSYNGTFSATTTGSDRRQTIGNKTANGVYLVVYVKLTNAGSAPAGGASFSVRDQQGRKFTYDFSGLLAGIGVLKGKAINIDIQPGITEDRFIVFEVPTDATTFTVEP